MAGGDAEKFPDPSAAPMLPLDALSNAVSGLATSGSNAVSEVVRTISSVAAPPPPEVFHDAPTALRGETLQGQTADVKMPAPPAPPKPAPPLPRRTVTMELTEVELQKLHTLDPNGQRFSAVLWTEWIFRGGLLDPDLAAKGEIFPIGADGRPTFRPSAEWFAAQVDYRNALSIKQIDRKRMNRGNDVVIVLRHEGVFTEIFELEHYPCDQQGLTITLNFNTRVTGPVPLELKISPSCTVSLECIHLCPPAKEWSIERHLIISPGLIGTGDREFPSMAFTATATRVPYFHILNLAVPMGLFSLLSVAQCYVTDATDVNHRAQLSLMLVLTASAYKMAIANKLPAIAYMTMLDSYTLWNFLVIIVIALESRSVGRGSQHMVPVGGQIDTAFTFCISVGWLIMHAYFGAKVQHYIRNPEAMDDRVIEQHPGSRIIPDKHEGNHRRSHDEITAPSGRVSPDGAWKLRSTIGHPKIQAPKPIRSALGHPSLV